MKSPSKILLGIVLTLPALAVLAGCVAEVGGGYGGGPWYHDGPWMDGGGWGGPRGAVGIEVHPPGFRR